MTADKLKRMPTEGKIGGVCAGFAYWLGSPVWIVRIFWALFIFFMGWGLILYILLWIFMPAWQKTPEDFKKVTGQ